MKIPVNRVLRLLVVLCSVALHVTQANAQARVSSQAPPACEDDDYEYQDPACKAGRWYGLPILAADGAALGMSIAALVLVANGDSDHEAAAVALGTGSAGLYLLGGPVVHWTEGYIGTGIGSLALRAGAPVGGALLGAALAGDGSFDALAGALFGFVLAVPGAIAIDSALLAFHPLTSEQDLDSDSSHAADGLRLQILPSWQPEHSAAGLQAVGLW